jgi:hypothetical protein
MPAAARGRRIIYKYLCAVEIKCVSKLLQTIILRGIDGMYSAVNSAINLQLMIELCNPKHQAV